MSRCDKNTEEARRSGTIVPFPFSLLYAENMSEVFYSIRSHTVYAALMRFYLIFFESIKHELFFPWYYFILSIHRRYIKRIFFISRYWNTSILDEEWIDYEAHTGFRLSWKRIFILMLLFFLIPALIIWQHIGFYLDDLLFPNWRKDPAGEVTAPVFIVGNARSGTTWLHRLLSHLPLAQEKTHFKKAFTTMHTWEMVFALSITWRFFFSYMVKVDQTISRGLGYYLIVNYLIETVFFSFLSSSSNHSRNVHEVRLSEAEEDEWAMIGVMGYAQLIMFFFPTASALLSPVIHYDTPVAPPEQTTGSKAEIPVLLDMSYRYFLFDQYKGLVQRHLFYHHKTTRRLLKTENLQLIYLSKNPTFTLRLTSLYCRFPDARVVVMLRDPMQSIPSMVSYISLAWKTFNTPINPYPQAKDLLGFCEKHYLYPLALSREKKPIYHSLDQLCFLSYHHLRRSLVKSLSPVIGRLLDVSDLVELVERIQQNLQQEQDRIHSFRSDHIYSFDLCCQGMTQDELQKKLELVYQFHRDAFQ
jgi:hypothetical protein